MERGNNVTENLRGTSTHISINHWGLRDCFQREQGYKKPSTKHTKSCICNYKERVKKL